MSSYKLNIAIESLRSERTYVRTIKRTQLNDSELRRMNCCLPPGAQHPHSKAATHRSGAYVVDDLRHTFASWAVQRGVTLHELMQLGGWSSYQTWLGYAHLAPDNLAHAPEKLCTNGTQRRAAYQISA